MKKCRRSLFFFLLSVFLLVRTAVSQDIPAAAPAKKDNTYVPSMHIRGGVILGINASQIDGDDYAGYHKVGLNLGFYGQIPVSKVFFVSTEILYSQKGSKSPTYEGQPLEYQINLQYAEIPVLLHFQDKKAFNVGVGLAYARLLKEEEWYKQNPNPPIEFCQGKPSNPSTLPLSFVCLHRSDYLVVADANYLPIKNLAINIRFAYSMAPFGYRGSSNFINRGMYTNMLSFRLMWIFGS